MVGCQRNWRQRERDRERERWGPSAVLYSCEVHLVCVGEFKVTCTERVVCWEGAYWHLDAFFLQVFYGHNEPTYLLPTDPLLEARRNPYTDLDVSRRTYPSMARDLTPPRFRTRALVAPQSNAVTTIHHPPVRPWPSLLLWFSFTLLQDSN